MKFTLHQDQMRVTSLQFYQNGDIQWRATEKKLTQNQ